MVDFSLLKFSPVGLYTVSHQAAYRTVRFEYRLAVACRDSECWIFDVQLIGKYFANGGRMLWTPNLPYRIPATVLQILPLVANLWGCRWDKFVCLFLFSFVVYVICLFQVLMPACLSLLSIVWNKCARHAGSGQCFRPALFWRHHTRLGVQFLGCHGMWP